jgi:hypothetical protein
MHMRLASHVSYGLKACWKVFKNERWGPTVRQGNRASSPKFLGLRQARRIQAY